MHTNHTTTYLVGLSLCLISALQASYAVERGQTSAGIDYVSGGVGQSELAMLNKEKRKYSFWLTTAAKKSGSYLAAVRVRIVNARTRQSVLEHTMDGPWLFAALPVGRYEVEATLAANADRPAQTLKKTTTIHPGDRHQMVLYFDTKDIVGLGNESNFKASPYDGK
jgi:hypothetical protein